jgi:hypothetical protein
MLELLSRAVLPHLSLHDALEHWDSICHQLAEPPPRQRIRQSLRLHDTIC